MATEPTPEAYEAAVQACRTQRTHVRPHDPDGMRAAVATVWPLAEAQVRAKVAAEIRAADTTNWPGGRGADVEDCRELAARIAEGKGDETPGRCAHDLNVELTTFSDTDRRYRCSARGCGFEWTVPR